MSLKLLTKTNVKSQTVLLRVDYNLPLTAKGQIASDDRVVASLKTINYLIDQNCKIVIFSHFGRIKTPADCQKYTLKKVVPILSKLLGVKVLFCKETSGNSVRDFVKNAPNDAVILIENTRFEDLNGNKESGNNKELSAFWASLGDVFVNDAFATIHRQHASNYGIASNCEVNCCGFLVKNEIEQLNHLINKPKKPFYVIIGGSKVKDKIHVINSLANIADKIFVGGAMAYSFLSCEGYNIGKSLIDKESVEIAKALLSKYPNKFLLPIDHKISQKFINSEPFNSISVDIPDDQMGMDIGIQTVKLFSKTMQDAATIFFNGTMGVYEFSNYKNGTLEICTQISKLNNVFSVIGGGDSVAAFNELNLPENSFSHISTGGGASLAYISKEVMPSLEILKK